MTRKKSTTTKKPAKVSMGLRDLAFRSRNKRTKMVTYTGEDEHGKMVTHQVLVRCPKEHEVREANARAGMKVKAPKGSTNPDEMQVDMGDFYKAYPFIAVRCALEPDTEERVFDDEDEQMVAEADNNFDEVVYKAAMDLYNEARKAGKKN